MKKMRWSLAIRFPRRKRNSPENVEFCMSFLSNMFNDDAKPPAKAESPLVNEVGAEFRPLQGGFFRTLEYPEVDSTGQPTGKCWLEAATDPKTGDWVLWQKSIRMTDDMLTGGKSSI